MCLNFSVYSGQFHSSISFSQLSEFSKYLILSIKRYHIYSVFLNIDTTCLRVVFPIRNVVIHTAYSNTCILRFLNVVFTIRNVVIHTTYSKIAYLCSVFPLLYLLPISLCDWSSLPAVSSSAQSVTCSHVYHFRNNTFNL